MKLCLFILKFVVIINLIQLIFSCYNQLLDKIEACKYVCFAEWYGVQCTRDMTTEKHTACVDIFCVAKFDICYAFDIFALRIRYIFARRKCAPTSYTVGVFIHKVNFTCVSKLHFVKQNFTFDMQKLHLNHPSRKRATFLNH